MYLVASRANLCIHRECEGEVPFRISEDEGDDISNTRLIPIQISPPPAFHRTPPAVHFSSSRNPAKAPISAHSVPQWPAAAGFRARQSNLPNFQIVWGADGDGPLGGGGWTASTCTPSARRHSLVRSHSDPSITVFLLCAAPATVSAVVIALR